MLKAALFSADVQDHLILRSDVQGRSNNNIGEIVDGERYRQILREEPEKELLPLIFYYDDAAPGNPLRQGSTVHNIGYFRFYLGNMPKICTATNKHIYLKAAGYTEDFSDYNYVAILEEIIAEIRDLFTNGIDVEFRGVQVSLKSFCDRKVALSRRHFKFYSDFSKTEF
jgi:hypothetical protein